MQTYVIQNGDTLSQISEMFGVSVDWLMQLNHVRESRDLFPGDILLIEPESKRNSPAPIDVKLFEIGATALQNIPGLLFINGDLLRFKATANNSLLINLRDVNETAIVPHPLAGVPGGDPSAPVLLSVTSFCNSGENTSVKAYYFAGDKVELAAFQETLAERVAAIGDAAEKVKKRPIAAGNLKKNIWKTVPTIPVPVKSGGEIKRVNTGDVSTMARRKRQLPPTRMQGESEILSVEETLELRKHIPSRFVNGLWRRLFCLSKDGCSYQTFFTRTERASPVVMVVVSSDGDKFGCFMSGTFSRSKKYYGNGEMFVFAMWQKVRVFRASGANTFYACSTESEISIGGGGCSAIWMDGNMLNGFSESCPTFDSPPLVKEERFKVLNVEVWTTEAG